MNYKNIKLNEWIKMSKIIEMDENNLIHRNLYKPPIKDTVTVPMGGIYCYLFIYRLIRFEEHNHIFL